MLRLTAIVACCVLLLSIVACNHSNPASGEESTSGSFVMVLHRTNMPAAVRFIALTLSRTEFPTVVRHVDVADSSVTVRIDSLATGTWRLQADAKDSLGAVIYTGWTFVEILPGQVTSVTLRLQQTTGALEVTLLWPGSRYVVSHDFNDGRVPEWGGGARLENLEGVIKFTTTEEISIKWEIFDYGFPGLFTKGWGV